MRRRAFHNIPVGHVVLFLRRQVLPVQEQELGPVEPDPHAAVPGDGGNFIRQFDVPLQVDPLAIERLGGKVPELVQLHLKVFIPLLPPEVIEERLFIGVHDHGAVVPVEDDDVAGP